ncbi:MAG: methylenetetrahydrofolate reductase [Candidatus Omnitrophica bacterium]|nr:methylenetetrahydrofolate reductase [Candidatus Omnitrophota bacterium]
MKKLTGIFETKPRTFSFEIFPPKTDKGLESLETALAELARLPFDFVSVTYGAGGSNRDTTSSLVRSVQKKYDLVALHHFTCVLHTRAQVKSILDELKASDVCNLLALRGDAPKDAPDWTPGPENFKYSSELVAFIRQHYNGHFAVGVAGFPEGHVLAPDKAFDAGILKKKIDAGGEFIMTQLFFDNALYVDYVKRLRLLGVTARVIPGVLPITNYEGMVNFCKGCGASVPQKIHDIFGPIAADKDKTLAVGTQFCLEQCRDLLAHGAPGIHFYSLNKVEPVRTILKALTASDRS